MKERNIIFVAIVLLLAVFLFGKLDGFSGYASKDNQMCEFVEKPDNSLFGKTVVSYNDYAGGPLKSMSSFCINDVDLVVPSCTTYGYGSSTLQAMEKNNIVCPYGFSCRGGRCISGEVSREGSCVDSDGNNVFTMGVTKAIDERGYEYSKQDICAGDKSVKEYTCVGDDMKAHTTSCPTNHICIKGACVEDELKEDSKCVDSDGNSIYEFGFVFVKDYSGEGLDKTFNDACVTQESITEYYCDSNGNPAHYQQTCPSHKCVSGACVN